MTEALEKLKQMEQEALASLGREPSVLIDASALFAATASSRYHKIKLSVVARGGNTKAHGFVRQIKFKLDGDVISRTAAQMILSTHRWAV